MCRWFFGLFHHATIPHVLIGTYSIYYSMFCFTPCYVDQKGPEVICFLMVMELPNHRGLPENPGHDDVLDKCSQKRNDVRGHGRRAVASWSVTDAEDVKQASVTDVYLCSLCVVLSVYGPVRHQRHAHQPSQI